MQRPFYSYQACRYMWNKFANLGKNRLRLVIMKFKISLMIEGPVFDPAAFDSRLEHGLKGNVRTRNHLSKKSKNRPIYWESNEIVSNSGYPEDALFRLLTAYENTLIEIRTKSVDVVIRVQMIEEYYESESPRGFYFSSALVGTLGRLGADLDVNLISTLG